MENEETQHLTELEQAKTPALLDQIRAGLGTENMTVEEMLAELRRIRDLTDDRKFSDSTELIREDRER